MSVIATIIRLLSTTSECPEVKLIDELNNFFNFDHNVFLLDKSKDVNCILCGSDIPQTVYTFDSSKNLDNRVDQLTEVEKLGKFDSKNDFMIVAPISAELERNAELLEQMKNTLERQSNIKIGIFFAQTVSDDILKKWFKWCKDQLIPSVFAATHSQFHTELSPQSILEIFTFSSFGVLDVINVTNSETYKSLFPSLDPNFHQHKLQLGSSFQWNFNNVIWSTVFDMMNATYSVVP